MVLSNNDGCVIARSEEAKALGIAMGTPSFFVEDFLKKNAVAVFSSNYTLYGDLSDRVMNTLHQFADQVEVYSIDEAFLDLSGMAYCNLKEYARKVKRTIKRNVGIPVSIGIAPSKTLAKMANRFAKGRPANQGVHIVDSEDKRIELLRQTEAGEIWGIGPQFTQLFKRLGFKTAFDVSAIPEDWMRKNLSVKGLRLLKELQGTSCIELEDMPASKKAVCVARGFGQLLAGKSEIQEALSNYTSRCAEKLRAEKSVTRLVHVFLQTNAHRQQDAQLNRSINIRLTAPTNSTNLLLKYAAQALDHLYKPGYNYKKVGIMAMDLVSESVVQTDLFGGQPGGKSVELMKSLDTINRQFGKESVRFVSQGFSQKWKLRQMKLSPCYTTRLEDILTINI